MAYSGQSRTVLHCRYSDPVQRGTAHCHDAFDRCDRIRVVKRLLVMIGKPDMVSVSLTGIGTRSPLCCDVLLCLPPHLVKQHERYSHPGLMVFFEAIAARDAYRSLVSAVKTEIEIKRASHSRVITIK